MVNLMKKKTVIDKTEIRVHTTYAALTINNELSL